METGKPRTEFKNPKKPYWRRRKSTAEAVRCRYGPGKDQWQTGAGIPQRRVYYASDTSNNSMAYWPKSGTLTIPFRVAKIKIYGSPIQCNGRLVCRLSVCEMLLCQLPFPDFPPRYADGEYPWKQSWIMQDDCDINCASSGIHKMNRCEQKGGKWWC